MLIFYRKISKNLEEGTNLIEVKNVTKRYGNFTAVDNINFSIQEGEIVGLLRSKWCWKKYYNEHDNRIYTTYTRRNYNRRK